MFPSLAAIQACCRAGALEKDLLLSQASPIVLLAKLATPHADFEIAPSVAPKNPSLGVMLPYSPLHHLLLRELNFPVVATSGNLTDEPICIDEYEALQRLHNIADVFLVHNRPIVRHMDDSVVRVMLSREMALRRARGYAPLPIPCATMPSQPALAVGAHLKNTVALGFGDQIILSQHMGDLETPQAIAAFQKSATDLPGLYEARPRIIAHDLHPEYLSTKFVHQSELAVSQARLLGVQHHYAHILSCMADNELSCPALGVSWDGTGFGTDGTIWGGEFLSINETGFERFAHFRQFRLPGGEAAIKQPRRCALGLLYEIYGPDLFTTDLRLLRQFSQSELQMLKRMLAHGINSPVTSSAGRFFDAIASIIGLRQRASFEGQAAMELEFACAPGVHGSYSLDFHGTKPVIFNWQPAVLQIMKECAENQSPGMIGAKFHNTLVELIVAVAHLSGEHDVALSGGCFQNQYLIEAAVRRLREEGFSPHWHHSVPPNDGGISLGQIIAASRADKSEKFEKPREHITVSQPSSSALVPH